MRNVLGHCFFIAFLLHPLYGQDCIEQKAYQNISSQETGEVLVNHIGGLMFNFSTSWLIDVNGYDSVPNNLKPPIIYSNVLFGCFFTDWSAGKKMPIVLELDSISVVPVTEVSVINNINSSENDAILSMEYGAVEREGEKYEHAISHSYRRIEYYEEIGKVNKVIKLKWNNISYFLIDHSIQHIGDMYLCRIDRELLIYNLIAGKLRKIERIPLGYDRIINYDNRFNFELCLNNSSSKYFAVQSSYEPSFSENGFMINVFRSEEQSVKNVKISYQITENNINEVNRILYD